METKPYPSFLQRVDRLPQQLEQLHNCTLTTRDNLKGVPQQGVYLFIENGKPLYVGRTNLMPRRLRQHSDKGSRHNDAHFAFKIAKENAKLLGVDITQTRKQLIANETFNEAFLNARLRVAKMNIKYIEIIHPIDQYLFEVYDSEALETPYNDFDNH